MFIFSQERDLNLDQATDVGEFTVKATKMWIHENYGAINGISNDICLLKVPRLNETMPESCRTAVNGSKLTLWLPPRHRGADTTLNLDCESSRQDRAKKVGVQKSGVKFYIIYHQCNINYLLTIICNRRKTKVEISDLTFFWILLPKTSKK